MKIKPLGKSLGTAITVNEYGKSCQATLTDVDLEIVLNKFLKKKWPSVSKNVANQTISFHSRKKRDLGTDSLLLKLVGAKYIIATSAFSDSSKVEKQFFEIVH